MSFVTTVRAARGKLRLLTDTYLSFQIVNLRPPLFTDAHPPAICKTQLDNNGNFVHEHCSDALYDCIFIHTMPLNSEEFYVSVSTASANVT
ncbi:unnamed protein product [Urochloa humidicola]